MSIAGLGGRIPLVAPEDLTPVQQQLYAAVAGTRGAQAESAGYRIADDEGRLIGPFNAFLAAPEIGTAQLNWAQAIGRAAIPGDVHEAVVLTVATIWDSAYMRYAHTAAGTRAGLSDDAVSAILAGMTSSVLGDAPMLASHLTRSLLAEHELDGALYLAASERFGTSGLVALIALIGHYTTTAAVLAAFDVPAPVAI